MTAAADIIDLLAGIRPGDALDALRHQRPQARENAQRSFQALLEPADAGSFPLAERYAIAAFVAHVHGFAAASDFYGDLLGDEAPELVAAVAAAARSGAATGPYGVYREPELRAESTAGPHWTAEAGLGSRLAAGLTHAHLLVFRPRESSPEALQKLADAGWSADDVVSVSQLVGFLSFQLRAAWALRILSRTPAASTPARTGEGA
ncbi:CMD domain protein [Microbacterium sp.]|uniref:CMD domain protein n=1 Tax=Microbacterium sp. TaxID=51671 RepID=UPI0025EAE02D|nr:CMD domain protein [Microbacterium sp.]